MRYGLIYDDANGYSDLVPDIRSGLCRSRVGMRCRQLLGGVMLVAVDGRLDSIGSECLERLLIPLVAVQSKLLIDLSEAEFIAATGLYLLLMCARAVGSRGGKLALLVAEGRVARTLRDSGIGALVEVFHDRSAAVCALA